LDADELTPGFDYHVIAGGVSPGLNKFEAMSGGAGHELQFSPFPTMFAILDRVLEFHEDQ
jgi:hypothetical protein